MKAALAIAFSLAAHAALIAAIALMAGADEDRAASKVNLDISSVELSLADGASEDVAVPAGANISRPAEKRNEDPSTPALRRMELPQTEPSAIEAGDTDYAPEPFDAIDIPEPSIEPSAIPAPSQEASRAVPSAPPHASIQAHLIAPAKPKSAIKPEYPPASRRDGEQGDVKLEIEVDERGLPSSARVVSSSGWQRLDEAALKAVRKARFIPAKSEGGNVPSKAVITLSFRIE